MAGKSSGGAATDEVSRVFVEHLSIRHLSFLMMSSRHVGGADVRNGRGWGEVRWSSGRDQKLEEKARSENEVRERDCSMLMQGQQL